MPSIYLSYETAVGSKTYTELPITNEHTTLFLPNTVVEGDISLSPEKDGLHSHLCLGMLCSAVLQRIIAYHIREIQNDLVLLCAVDDTDGPYSVIGDNQISIQLPISTASHLKSIVLRENDQFVTSSSRWAVVWDDENGTISNSMRPPPLPVVNNPHETHSPSLESLPDTLRVEDSEQEEVVFTEEVVVTQKVVIAEEVIFTEQVVVTEQVAVSEELSNEEAGKLASDSACLKSRPSGTVARVASQEPTVRSGLNPTENVAGMPDNHTDMNTFHLPQETSPILGHAEASSDDASTIAKELDQEGDVVAGSTQAVPEVDWNEVAEIFVSSSNGRAEAGTHPALVTASSAANGKRGTKRGHQETENPESSTDSADVDDHIPVDAIDTDPPLASTQPTTKSTYSGRRRRKLLQMLQPSRGPTSQGSPVTKEPTPRSGLPTEYPAKRRSPRAATNLAAEYVGPAPVVIFSSSTKVDEQKAVMKSFARLGGKTTVTINKATVLCLPKGPVKRTSKLLMAVALGIDIVTEDWLADIHRLEVLPATGQYLPTDTSAEQEWNISLREAIARGRQGLTHLLSGTTVYFTKQLRTDLGNLERDFSQIATKLGAESVERRLPALKDHDKASNSAVLVVGVRNDPQSLQVARLGYTLFDKDVLTMAVLRGRLERDSEDFVIDVPVKDEEGI